MTHLGDAARRVRAARRACHQHRTGPDPHRAGRAHR